MGEANETATSGAAPEMTWDKVVAARDALILIQADLERSLEELQLVRNAMSPSGMRDAVLTLGAQIGAATFVAGLAIGALKKRLEQMGEGEVGRG